MFLNTEHSERVITSEESHKLSMISTTEIPPIHQPERVVVSANKTNVSTAFQADTIVQHLTMGFQPHGYGDYVLRAGSQCYNSIAKCFIRDFWLSVFISNLADFCLRHPKKYR